MQESEDILSTYENKFLSITTKICYGFEVDKLMDCNSIHLGIFCKLSGNNTIVSDDIIKKISNFIQTWQYLKNDAVSLDVERVIEKSIRERYIKLMNNNNNPSL